MSMEKVAIPSEMIAVFERIWKAQGREGTFTEFVEQRAAASEEVRIKHNVDDYNRQRGNLDEEDGYDCKICKNKGDIWQAVKYYDSWKETAIRCDCAALD